MSDINISLSLNHLSLSKLMSIVTLIIPHNTPLVNINNICTEMSIIADSIDITIINDQITFHCKGNFAERTSIINI